MISNPGNSGINDIVNTFKNWRIINFIAISDLQARYKRSVLGPIWLTIGTAAGSVGLGVLWSELLKIEAKSFIPSLTLGLILWQLISGIVSESAILFGRQASIIRNIKLPLGIHPFQLVFKHVINLLHNVPIFLILIIVFNLKISAVNLLFIPGLFLLILNLIWISFFISIVGARFRDMEFIVSAILPLLMFISPVFYRPNYIPFSEVIIWFNPLSHLIEIVRSPLLGSAAPNFVIYTNVGMLLFGGGFTLWLFNKKLNRIAFWV